MARMLVNDASIIPISLTYRVLHQTEDLDQGDHVGLAALAMDRLGLSSVKETRKTPALDEPPATDKGPRGLLHSVRL